jgi:hypothetical protein
LTANVKAINIMNGKGMVLKYVAVSAARRDYPYTWGSCPDVYFIRLYDGKEQK